MTIGIAAGIVGQYPRDAIDRYAIENISLLIEIRDNAIHFHNAGRGPRKRVQEIGSAALRNFAYAAKAWFACDLSSYHFALMPFAFDRQRASFGLFSRMTRRAQPRRLQSFLRSKNKRSRSTLQRHITLV